MSAAARKLKGPILLERHVEVVFQFVVGQSPNTSQEARAVDERDALFLGIGAGYLENKPVVSSTESRTVKHTGLAHRRQKV